MTYAELLACLQRLTPEQMEQTVTVALNRKSGHPDCEYIPVTDIETVYGSDVLDDEHFVLVNAS